MKTTVTIIATLTAVLLTACQPPLPPVPPSNRTPVGPEGSSANVKPWNQTTRQEGNAVLGPLSDMNRR